MVFHLEIELSLYMSPSSCGYGCIYGCMCVFEIVGSSHSKSRLIRIGFCVFFGFRRKRSWTFCYFRLFRCRISLNFISMPLFVDWMETLKMELPHREMSPFFSHLSVYIFICSRSVFFFLQFFLLNHLYCLTECVCVCLKIMCGEQNRYASYPDIRIMVVG